MEFHYDGPVGDALDNSADILSSKSQNNYVINHLKNISHTFSLFLALFIHHLLFTPVVKIYDTLNICQIIGLVTKQNPPI